MKLSSVCVLELLVSNDKLAMMANIIVSVVSLETTCRAYRGVHNSLKMM